MEYCDCGSIRDIINEKMSEKERNSTESSICLGESQIAAIAKQVLEGLAYLHSNRKMHRDMKANNILLNSRGFIKIADFGFGAQGDDKRSTQCGTSYWLAPEAVNSAYDAKIDIWAFGITLIEMAEGKPPYSDDTPQKAMLKIVQNPPPRLQAPNEWSDGFKNFIARCLVKKADARPTAEQLLLVLYTIYVN